MLSSSQAVSQPRRINIPFIIDLVIVTDASQIKAIETSGNVDRLHAYDTAVLPWWVKFYFQATKFHDAERDLWFCPFESTTNPTYQPRRTYLEEKVATGYSPNDVQKIAQLLKTNADDEVLAQEMVQIVNQRFFGKEIPVTMTQIAKHTLQKISEAIIPTKYKRAQKSQQEIMNYCAQNLSQDVHILDIGHNIGEVVQTTTGALKVLKENLDKPVEDIFTAHPLTPQAPRIATQASTFEGLLSSPAKPGKTVFLFKIGDAAIQTQDILFTFGTGSEERVCVFKDFFLQFMRDLQQELKSNPGN